MKVQKTFTKSRRKILLNLKQILGQRTTHNGNQTNGKLWLCFKRCLISLFANAEWRKVKQMHPMRLCVLTGRQFKDTFENAQRRKGKQMQPVWLCLFSCRRFEETFENTHWRKVKQMKPMQLCIPLCKRFEDTFENAHWRKVK